MRARGVLTLLIAVFLAGTLSACGSFNSSSQATSTAAPAEASTATTTSPPNRSSTAKASPHGSSASTSPGSTRSREGSAPFRTHDGDNSIPNYGAEVPASQRGSAAVALHGYLDARAAGRWSTACSYLGKTVRAQLEVLAKAGSAKVKGCVDSYALLSKRIPAKDRADPLIGGLASLRVKGDKAFALFYGPHRQQYMVPMVHEAGSWKTNQIQPIPYPIGAPSVRGH